MGGRESGVKVGQHTVVVVIGTLSHAHAYSFQVVAEALAKQVYALEDAPADLEVFTGRFVTRWRVVGVPKRKSKHFQKSHCRLRTSIVVIHSTLVRVG